MQWRKDMRCKNTYVMSNCDDFAWCHSHNALIRYATKFSTSPSYERFREWACTYHEWVRWVDWEGYEGRFNMSKQSTNTRGIYYFAKSRGKPSCVIIVWSKGHMCVPRSTALVRPLPVLASMIPSYPFEASRIDSFCTLDIHHSVG